MVVTDHDSDHIDVKDVPVEVVDSFTFKGHTYYRICEKNNVEVVHSPECPKCFQIFD